MTKYTINEIRHDRWLLCAFEDKLCDILDRVINGAFGKSQHAIRVEVTGYSGPMATKFSSFYKIYVDSTPSVNIWGYPEDNCLYVGANPVVDINDKDRVMALIAMEIARVM